MQVPLHWCRPPRACLPGFKCLLLHLLLLIPCLGADIILAGMMRFEPTLLTQAVWSCGQMGARWEGQAGLAHSRAGGVEPRRSAQGGAPHHTCNCIACTPAVPHACCALTLPPCLQRGDAAG